MARKAWQGLVVIVALVLVYFLGPQLLPESYLEKRRVEELISSGVIARAKVVDKRIERIRNPAQGKSETQLFVVLDYEGRILEQAFLKGTPEIREAWEKVKIGDSVEIRVHPDRRDSFIAPEYLNL